MALWYRLRVNSSQLGHILVSGLRTVWFQGSAIPDHSMIVVENCNQLFSQQRSVNAAISWKRYLFISPHEIRIFVGKIFPSIFYTYFVRNEVNCIFPVSCRTGSEVRIWDSLLVTWLIRKASTRLKDLPKIDFVVVGSLWRMFMVFECYLIWNSNFRNHP